MKNLALMQRLWMLTGVLIAIPVIVGLVNVANSHVIRQHVDFVKEVSDGAESSASHLHLLHEQLKLHVIENVLVRGSENSGFTFATREHSQRIIGEERRELERLIREDYSPEVKREFSELKAQLFDFIDFSAALVGNESVKSIDDPAMKDFDEKSDALEAKLEHAFETAKKWNEEQYQEVSNEMRNGVILLSLCVVAGGFVAFAMAFWMSKQIRQSMKAIASSLEEEARKVGSGSSEILHSSKVLAQATTEQSAAISETAASMEQMSSMISQTASNSSRSLDEAERGRREAAKGKEVIQKMSLSMNDIQAANERLKKIVRIIEEINSRTKIINEIASETRLLSFNASIEAARAGTHGRGFAVVAEEVGKLAATSSSAANDIRSMLEKSMQEVSEAVNETQSRVSHAQDVSTECEKAFATMESTLVEINEALQRVTAATKEQEIGVRQTNRAITEMDSVVQSNSRSAESLATEASYLDNSSRLLQATVSSMRTFVFGADESNGRQLPHADVPRDNRELRPAAPMVSSGSGSESSAPGKEENRSENVDRNDSRWRAA